MKVHRVTILVVDHDDLGVEGVIQEIENVNYPNDCMHPTVLAVETREVEWSDDHPLNYTSKLKAAAKKLFEGP